MPTQSLSSRDTVVFVGDSLTAGTPTPWFTTAVATINAAFVPTNKVYGGIVTGRSATATGGVVSVAPTPNAPVINAINSGVGGNQVNDILIAIPARITNFNPTAVVMCIGINDCVVGNTPLATYRASLDSIWAAVLAHNPACKLWAASIYCWGEMFNAGPVWNNPYDGPPGSGNPLGLYITDYNGQAQASVIAAGGLFSESRNETLALIASLSSPPGNHTGPTTLDGEHPNTGFGQPLMSTQFMSTVQIVTT